MIRPRLPRARSAPADRWCSRRRCSGKGRRHAASAASRSVAADLLRRIALGQRPLEVRRRSKQRALDRAPVSDRPMRHDHAARAMRHQNHRPLDRRRASVEASTQAAQESLSRSIRGTVARLGQLLLQHRLPVLGHMVAQPGDDQYRRASRSAFGRGSDRVLLGSFARITFLSSLPTLVFGIASTKCTRSGTAYREIAPRSAKSATWLRIASSVGGRGCPP